MREPPPRHFGPCKNAEDGNEHDEDVTEAGRYRALCGVCRPLVAAAQKQRKSVGVGAASPDLDDGMEDEIRARSRRSNLKRACEELVPAAEKLERALDDRNRARMRASIALSEFREALQLVGRVAQSLVNQRSEPGANGHGPS